MRESEGGKVFGIIAAFSHPPRKKSLGFLLHPPSSKCHDGSLESGDVGLDAERGRLGQKSAKKLKLFLAHKIKYSKWVSHHVQQHSNFLFATPKNELISSINSLSLFIILILKGERNALL